MTFFALKHWTFRGKLCFSPRNGESFFFSKDGVAFFLGLGVNRILTFPAVHQVTSQESPVAADYSPPPGDSVRGAADLRCLGCRQWFGSSCLEDPASAGWTHTCAGGSVKRGGLVIYSFYSILFYPILLIPQTQQPLVELILVLVDL